MAFFFLRASILEGALYWIDILTWSKTTYVKGGRQPVDICAQVKRFRRTGEGLGVAGIAGTPSMGLTSKVQWRNNLRNLRTLDFGIWVFISFRYRKGLDLRHRRQSLRHPWQHIIHNPLSRIRKSNQVQEVRNGTAGNHYIILLSPTSHQSIATSSWYPAGW
jgi:hypothetical protein